MGSFRRFGLGMLGVALVWGSTAVCAYQDVPLGEQIRSRFAAWLKTDPNAVKARTDASLSNVEYSADGLIFVEPDRVKLVASAPASDNAEQAKSALSRLVILFLSRDVDQLLQSRGMEKAVRDPLLAAMKSKLEIRIETVDPSKQEHGVLSSQTQAVSRSQTTEQTPSPQSPTPQASGQWVAARPVFTTSTAEPLNAEHLYNKAMTHYWDGRYAEARDCLDSAIGQAPNNPSAWYFKGLCELTLGDGLAAQASVKQGAAIQATNESLSHEVGRSLERVQGPVRLWIEQALSQARSDAANARSARR